MKTWLRRLFKDSDQIECVPTPSAEPPRPKLRVATPPEPAITLLAWSLDRHGVTPKFNVYNMLVVFPGDEAATAVRGGYSEDFRFWPTGVPVSDSRNEHLTHIAVAIGWGTHDDKRREKP